MGTDLEVVAARAQKRQQSLDRRADAFRLICELCRYRPADLRDVPAPDLAAMLRRLGFPVADGDISGLSGMVEEFLTGG